ncbi:hypothetical protein L218DRAFT_947324 [Marasmius fiardii PR-910]|nr:hypothetical protein L218DRAFT_947324 [Marasmius fiardii PR-910]
MAFAARLTFFLTIFCFAPLNLAAPAATCSLETVTADVAQISAQTLTLDSHILGFPDSGATVIHADFQSLAGAIDLTAADMEPCPAPFTDDVFNNLLNSVQEVLGQETTMTNDLVTMKPAFDAGGVSSTIKQDLNNLLASSLVLEQLWVARAPADLQGQAQDLANKINSALTTAQAAYE